jgi:hypothetical protein
MEPLRAERDLHRRDAGIGTHAVVDGEAADGDGQR